MFEFIVVVEFSHRRLYSNLVLVLQDVLDLGRQLDTIQDLQNLFDLFMTFLAIIKPQPILQQLFVGLGLLCANFPLIDAVLSRGNEAFALAFNHVVLVGLDCFIETGIFSHEGNNWILESLE